MDLFRVETGETLGGDVETGELGKVGERLLLLEVGGLEDQKLGTFSLEQAGMVLFFGNQVNAQVSDGLRLVFVCS